MTCNCRTAPPALGALALLLVGSSASGGSYAAVTFRVEDNGALTVTRKLQGEGAIALAPTLTSRGLTLPTSNRGGVKNIFVPVEALGVGDVMGIESCL